MTTEQLQAIRDEAAWWSEEANADYRAGSDPTYARGQAAGLRRALRMLEQEDH
ncbi:MAG: hypothetical protein L0G94_10540 [Brachybacterium sp.]|uniref:hypothetical protein n=1 Tax=Brachybacterium sp. TaxID=1891286 RepID=UPI0026483BAB|nr:hypothetical protein [Brachybacterium sp.]MDN5687093.1 hypothetical protein [Brachybacterium sp.]